MDRDAQVRRGLPPEVDALARLFQQTREPTVRKLVEFYESDWENISALKEGLDLSWKDFFRSISTWVSVIQNNEALQSHVAALLDYDPDAKSVKAAHGGGGD